MRLRPERQIFAETSGTAPGRGRLNGRNILVVGGGQQSFEDADAPIGNGRAICELAAREGAAIACIDRSIDAAQAVCDVITEGGGTCHAIAADVARPEAIKRSVAEAAELLGRIDGLVANVGIISGLPLGRLTADDWNRVFDVNLRSHMLYCRLVLDMMPDGASIVLMSSLAAFHPGVNQPAYEVSKAGVIALTRSAAMAGEPRAIRCNCIVPGLIDTPLGRLEGRRRKDRARAAPFGRQGTGWEIAYPTVFLLSGEASYINAQSLTVDGGYHAGLARPL